MFLGMQQQRTVGSFETIVNMRRSNATGRNDEHTHLTADEQPSGKKRKKTYDPAWQAIISAIRERDANAAWISYQEWKLQPNFRPAILKAIANLFLGQTLALATTHFFSSCTLRYNKCQCLILCRFG